MTNRLPNIPILMYHEVWANLSPESKIRHTNPAYIVSRQTFEEQMQYLRDEQFRALTLDEYLDGSRNDDRKSVIITFDDGWSNNYWEAFPILKRLRLKATVFIVTDFIGQKGYMDWAQLEEMQKEGISIQSHTVSHGALTQKSVADISKELKMSKHQIEDSFGITVEFLSAPHGMVNQKVIDAARKLGYRAICTSEPGFTHVSGDLAVLQRINISDRCALSLFAKIVRANYRAILPTIWSQRYKSALRKMIGYDNYRKIYRLRYRIGS